MFLRVHDDREWQISIPTMQRRRRPNSAEPKKVQPEFSLRPRGTFSRVPPGPRVETCTFFTASRPAAQAPEAGGPLEDKQQERNEKEDREDDNNNEKEEKEERAGRRAFEGARRGSLAARSRTSYPAVRRGALAKVPHGVADRRRSEYELLPPLSLPRTRAAPRGFSCGSRRAAGGRLAGGAAARPCLGEGERRTGGRGVGGRWRWGIQGPGTAESLRSSTHRNYNSGNFPASARFPPSAEAEP